MKTGIEARFMEGFCPEPNSGCWLWVRAVDKAGYGRLDRIGSTSYAHRVAYHLLRGPLTPGLTIDHLCRVRSCVNPAHMEEVTKGENTRRGQSLTARNIRAGICVRGHPRIPENRNKFNQCILCNRIRGRTRRMAPPKRNTWQDSE